MIRFWQDKNKHEVDILIDEKQKAYLINLNSQTKKKGIVMRLPYCIEVVE